MQHYFHIDTWSYLKQFVVCLMFGGLVVAVGYRVDIKPLQDKLSLQQTQIATTRELISNKKQLTQKSKLAEQKSPLLLAPSMMNTSGLEMAQVLNDLERSLLEAQVEPYLFEPQPIRENEWLLVCPVKLELSGVYKNLPMFIIHLIKNHHFIVIEEMVLQKKSANDSERLNIKILLAIYKNKKAWSQAMVTKDWFIPMPERDIFQPLKNQVSLYLWASRELRFLGLVRQARSTFGVVSDPLGEIYRVAVGDKIGLNQSRITAISEHGIVTTNAADNLGSGK